MAGKVSNHSKTHRPTILTSSKLIKFVRNHSAEAFLLGPLLNIRVPLTLFLKVRNQILEKEK